MASDMAVHFGWKLLDRVAVLDMLSGQQLLARIRKMDESPLWSPASHRTTAQPVLGRSGCGNNNNNNKIILGDSDRVQTRVFQTRVLVC